MASHVPVAPHRLRILVVGGSIAGLASAYTLSRAGHDVTVFEKRDGPSESIAAACSPPHMTRILKRWGLSEEWISQKGHATKNAVFQDATKDKLFHKMGLEDLYSEDAAPFLSPRHCDLNAWLVDLVRAQGVQILYGSDVTHVDPQRPSVHLVSGETFLGDIVVGADGYASRLRPIVTGEDFHFKPPRRMAYSINIPAEKVQTDPELVALLAKDEWNIWMYQDMYLNGFFNGQHYCFVLHWPGDDTTGMDSRWDLSLAPDAMNMHAMGVPNPALLRLASLIESATPLPELDYEPLDSWVHEDSKVLLVGDAAAPFPIPGLYSVSVGFEDAEVLGALLGRVRKVENIPALLAAYDELRPDRAADLAKRERNQVAGWQQLTSRDAPPQHALATNGDVDEDEVALRKFEEYLQVVGCESATAAHYDCYEVASDWLQQFPSLLEDSDDKPAPAWFDIQRNVTVLEHRHDVCT